MVAYFPSKYLKRVQAAFVAAALLACLLGTHWLGYSHGISHAGLQTQSTEQCSAADLPAGVAHSSDACHLFDALTLAGFVPADGSSLAGLETLSSLVAITPYLRAADSVVTAYQSRAPPVNIL